MIRAVLSDDAFVRNVEASAKSQERLHLWWLGQSGFLVQWNGVHLLLDPYLSDSLTEKYRDTDRPHVRMTELPVDPRRLDFIDIVTSSHNHTDHLDAATLRSLMEVNPGLSLVIPEANREFVAERLGCEESLPVGLDDDLSVKVGATAITGVAAAHEEIDRDEEGRCRCLGYVIQLGPWTLYHSGDTLVYEGLERRLRGFAIDIAILPINGRDPARGVAGNMTGLEAARLARAIDARLVIPCHFEMFEFNTASPDEFSVECQRLDQPFRVLRCGERWSDRDLSAAEELEDPMLDRLGGRGRFRGLGETDDF
jgi:L-ascorbate metabolism protein UlaG (beta-lactamase superfamily)